MSKAQIAVIENDPPMTERQSGQLAPVTPSDLLRIAVEQGADLDKLERLMDLQDRHNAATAERVYNAAFAAFKSEAVRIIKGREVTDGPLRGRSYAELSDIVHAVTPALSRHGLSASWRLTKDEPQWIEVTCYLKHVDGHSESASMGGAPDTGGAKNALQARASTKTYLERYTLKAILGVAEGGDDDDGEAGRGPLETPKKPAEKPTWPDDKWQETLPRMIKGIQSGKTVEDALAWLRAKGNVTPEQEQQLRDAVAQQHDAETGEIQMTAEHVLQRMRKADTLDKLNEAASLIDAAPEVDRAQLNQTYDELMAQIQQGEKA